MGILIGQELIEPAMVIGDAGGAAPPPPFSPADLADLVLWLSSSSVVNTAGAAETLIDLGPNGYSLTQSSAPARATIVAGDAVFGGQPSLSFAGAQWYEQLAVANLPCTEALTVVVVGSVTTALAGGPRGFLAWWANATQGGGVYSAPYFYQRIQGTGLCRVLLQSAFDTNLSPSDNTAHCWLSTHDGASELRAYRDGTEMTPTPASRMASLAATAPVLRVGTTDGTVVAPAAAQLVGKLGAILVYDRVLDATERGQILLWSQDTYGTP